MNVRMEGHLPELGLQAGFFSPNQYNSFTPGQSIPIITRGLDQSLMSTEQFETMGKLQRGEFTGDVNSVLVQLGMNMQQLQRAILSSNSAFPVRENLEDEAKILIPIETPIRNMLPRRVGSGLASQWRQLISLGGGYAAATTTTQAIVASAAQSIAVASSSGFAVGKYIYLDSGATQEYLPITAIADGTHITINPASNHANGTAVALADMQTGSTGIGNLRTFFAENGAPAEHTSQYVNQLASYKLMGTFGQVSGFANAAGANFQNQLAQEKANALRNLMLNEENALLNGDASSVAAPWGDGANPLAFSGLNNLVTTANGTPADQIQTAVGALTTAHIDNQLRRLWFQGAQTPYMIMSAQESLSLVHLAEGNGSIIRVQATSNGETVLGVKVTGYVHPITGELIPVHVARFQASGSILFGSQRLPDGSPSADVEVLPQVQLPQLAPNENIQGYCVQEIAPTTNAPQMYPFICTVFEVLRMKSAKHFAKSTGVSAV
ncbi:MAG: DUF5309 family protein [Capsulimonas sp.]|uniref:SU10 major capsid protein n=1 Tax=Capsulimonas sp. TaxID=2494211 RepID=UPI003265BA9F